MKPLLFLFAAFLTLTALADEKTLAGIKGSVFVPDGWFLREETNDGVAVCQITREQVASANDGFTAGLILTATPKIPELASMKPSQYAEELLSASQDTPPTKTQEGPFQCYCCEYTIESEQGNIKTVSLAKANDKTGTLIFITWQSPDKEEATLKDVREKIFKSLKVDPEL